MLCQFIYNKKNNNLINEIKFKKKIIKKIKLLYMHTHTHDR